MFAVVLVVFVLLPAPKPEPEAPHTGPGTDLTPLDEGGFPTPPMDLVVPATPRSLAQSAQGRVAERDLVPAGSVTSAPAPSTETDA